MKSSETVRYTFISPDYADSIDPVVCRAYAERCEVRAGVHLALLKALGGFPPGPPDGQIEFRVVERSARDVEAGLKEARLAYVEAAIRSWKRVNESSSC